MNRRLFLTGVGATSVAPLMLTSKKTAYGQSGSLDPNLIAAVSNAHVVATANAWAGNTSATDWANVRSVTAALSQSIQANGLDASFTPSVPNAVDPSTIDLTAATQAIQMYQPGFQLSDMQSLYASIPTDPSSIASACSYLQVNGLTGLCSKSMFTCNQLIQALNSPNAVKQQNPASLLHSPTPNEKIAPPNCAADGAGIFFAGTAFAVIAIMAGPAGVLAYAFWASLAFWGGTAVSLWGIGHVLVCPF